MIKLERIYVQNYKNIAEADLPLGQMNVIVGENSAGKSNLLGVIPFLNLLINGAIDSVQSRLRMGGNFGEYGFIISEYNPQNILLIQIEFSDTEKNILYKYDLQIEAEEEVDTVTLAPLIISKEIFTYKSRTKTGKPIIIFNRNKTKIDYGEGIKNKNIINTIDNYSSVIRLLNIILNSNQISVNYKNSLNALKEVLNAEVFYFSPHLFKNDNLKASDTSRLSKYDLTEALFKLNLDDALWKDFLSTTKALIHIDKIELPKKEHGDLFVFFYQGYFPNYLEGLSDGTIILLALIIKIYSDTSDIILIEEPENSIHPRALSELMKLIREKSLDKQFIITTHSPYLLNMIKPEEVLIAERQENGLSKIGKLPDLKAIKKKLAKGFMDFGDIVFEEPIIDSDSE